MPNLPQDSTYLYDLAHNSLLELSTEEGINASAKSEAYGCIFGRDSAISILKILRSHGQKPSLKLLEVCRRGLLTLSKLQGKEFNIESGEEPGKFIHEFRKDKTQIERFSKFQKPWFIYPDGLLKNYDSIDSTPLTLIAMYKYWQITQDNEFLNSVLPSVEAGLNWIISYGDRDGDAFIEYELPQSRNYGGLRVQSWTDSVESLLKIDGTLPQYPIAPIEAQAYAWLAFKLWSDYYNDISPKFARKMRSQARMLKKKFNEQFIFESSGLYYGVQALDGSKNPIKTITGNPMLCLWAAYQKGGKTDTIVEKKYLADFVERVFMDDMFVADAGIRTMSDKSTTFNPDETSYHNGSFWPILNGMIIGGLRNTGFYHHAQILTEASLAPIKHFGSPIELYIKKGNEFVEYKSSGGQVSCRVQAWSAAAILNWPGK